MKQKKNIQNFWKKFGVALCVVGYLILALFGSCLGSLKSASADNAVKAYSNVLDDLQSDENFIVEDFPVDEDNFSLQVIQVAESVDKELFVYVYQPTGEEFDLRATHLNMSLDDDASSTSIYSLTYLNSSGTLFKYKVDDVVVSSDVLRYYNVTSIYRNFLKGVDDELGYDNTINEVSFNVGKIWEAYTSTSKGVVYSCYETETITITEKYVGYLFSGNVNSQRGQTEGYKNYFVAFSTDHEIDKLLEATVYYVSTYRYVSGVVNGSAGSSVTWTDNSEEPEEVEKTLYADEVVDVTTGRWFWKKSYTFDRISTTDDFITDETRQNTYVWGLHQADTYSLLTDETETTLKSAQYVLRFYKSYYNEISQPNASFGAVYSLYDCTDVSNVSIINLKFETNGVTYSMGVIDNMQTGSDKPSNIFGENVGLADWVKKALSILAGALGVFLLIIALCCFPAILNVLFMFVKAIFKIVCWVFKSIWWVITLPFKVFKRNK